MSLRLRLTFALALLLTLVAAGAAAYAFWAATRESDAFLDRQQRQMARYVGDLAFVPADAVAIPSTESEDDYVVIVRYRDGRPMRSSHPAIDVPPAAETGFSIFTDAVGTWRVFTAVLPERTIQIAQQMAVRSEIAQDGAWNAALPIVVSIPLIWIVLALVLQVAFRPLERAAREIAIRDVADTTPIDPVSVPPEVRPLVAAIDDLLARLHAALRQQQAFIGEAAHALRTPLAALTLQLDNVRAALTGPHLGERLDELERGVKRAAMLADKLLVLARAEAHRAPRTDRAALDAILTQAVADLTPVAITRGVDLGFRERKPVSVRVDPHDLRVLADILIDNAVRYTPKGGVVDVSVTRQDGAACLSVADTGPGIPDALLPSVFERFFRAAPTEIEGSGLGLAIARSIAERHGLSLTLRRRSEATGLIATVRFDEAADLSRS